MSKLKINFIGAGNIAHAVITGLINNGYKSELISVCVPSALRRNFFLKKFQVKGFESNIEGSNQANIIILAVKPQVIEKVCIELKNKIDFSKKLIISFAIGININFFYNMFGSKINIVRIMPNISCAFNQGVSGIYVPCDLKLEYKEYITEIMGKISKLVWLDNEHDINYITAITGSSPAYFLILMKAIQEQAILFGFSEYTARVLLLKILDGMKYLIKDKSESFDDILSKIASKGGTTIAAINVFKKNQISKIVSDAMKAVVFRAKEIEKMYSSENND